MEAKNMNANDIYEHISFKDAEVPFVLHDLTLGKTHSLGRHNWHESLEILFFTSGSADVTCNFQEIQANPGDIVVINPNTLHNIYARSTAHYYCLIIDRAFCISNYIDTSDIHFDALVRDSEISALIEQFVSEYKNSDLICRSQFLRSTALRILALLKGQYSKASSPKEEHSTVFSGVKKALSYIHSKSHTKITLEDLSKFSGLSKFYLAREFRNLVGCTVVEYINQVRCENAKRMLQEDQMSIAAIAESCGYPNPAYFTQIFLRNTGFHPSQYKKQFKH